MEFIRKTLCIQDYYARFNDCDTYIERPVNLPSGSCENYLQPNDYISGYTHGSNDYILTGLTDDGSLVYYNSGETSNASIARFNILFNNRYDDLGFMFIPFENFTPNKIYYQGDYIINNDYSYIYNNISGSSTTFNTNDWVQTPTGSTNNTVYFTGESKINEFRRFGKDDVDLDLYNPIWNTGFTFEVVNANGEYKKITGERINTLSSNSPYPLYDYEMGIKNTPETYIHYSDNINGDSTIHYQASGLTKYNSIEHPCIKEDYLVGIIDAIKVNSDVFIDRGINSVVEKNIKLNEIKSLDSLSNYGGGFFNIIEQ